ncbi:MAG: ribosome biogenesis GTPase Der [Nevskiales bacterium]
MNVPIVSGRLPVIALVGRPNVGKSTLFNVLTRSRNALVGDRPGVTRDRQYGFAEHAGRRFIVCDTAGLSEEHIPLAQQTALQTQQALAEADGVLVMVDARAGPNASDEAVIKRVRTSGKPAWLVANKAEGLNEQNAVTDFYRLGLGAPRAISAEHNQGVAALLDLVLAAFPPGAEPHVETDEGVRVAIVGRPNVGKSTLVNRLLGEERVLTLDFPGTTRDAIHIPFERDGRKYTLIDTAGVRRRAKVEDAIEKFSVIKTLQAIESAHVVIVVVDAQEDIGVQDARILGLVADSGRALVIAINKWDGLESSARGRVKSEVDRKLPFLDYAQVEFISALHGSGLRELMKAVNEAYRAATAELPTPKLNEALQQALEAHSPPAVLGRRIKLRYAHQGGNNPPVIVVHGNQTEKLPVSYKRYLVHRFREAFKLWGTPVQLVFKTGENPYRGRPAGDAPRRGRRAQKS